MGIINEGLKKNQWRSVMGLKSSNFSNFSNLKLQDLNQTLQGEIPRSDPPFLITPRKGPGLETGGWQLDTPGWHSLRILRGVSPLFFGSFAGLSPVIIDGWVPFRGLSLEFLEVCQEVQNHKFSTIQWGLRVSHIIHVWYIYLRQKAQLIPYLRSFIFLNVCIYTCIYYTYTHIYISLLVYQILRDTGGAKNHFIRDPPFCGQHNPFPKGSSHRTSEDEQGVYPSTETKRRSYLGSNTIWSISPEEGYLEDHPS